MTKKRHSLGDLDDKDDLIKVAVKRRGVVKSKLTIFIKFLNELESLDKVTEIQIEELRSRFNKAEPLLEQFTELQDEIDIYISDHLLDRELKERQSFEDLYYASVAKSKCKLNEFTPKQGQSCSQSKIKLPTISLPAFDGSYDHWLEFRDTYLSLIHNSKDIDNIQKFHYLRSALTGNALQIIKSLEFSSENYVTAWDLLENRYNNNRLLVHNHVKALFSAQSISKESAPQLRKLLDTILKNIRALKSLGEPTDSWDTLIIYIIVSKLDSSTEREWELHKSTLNNSTKREKISLVDLTKFLKDRADVLETINVTHSQNRPIESKKQSLSSNSSFSKTHSHVAGTSQNHNNSNKAVKSKRSRSCTLCNSNHPIYACEMFLNLSINDKLKHIEQNKLCHNCLRAGHVATSCWFGPCKRCNLKHNSLIHVDSDSDDSGASTSSAVAHIAQPVSQNNNNQAKGSQAFHATALTANSLYDQQQDSNQLEQSILEPVLLSTALVEIADKYNNYHTVKALLDNGSQHCFISKGLCNTLDIPLLQSTVQITGVGSTITQSTHTCEIQLKSKTSAYITRFKCLVLPRITAQPLSLDFAHNIQVPDNIQLADPNFFSQVGIDLLIGANKFWELLNEGLIRLPSGPVLQNTKLGWIISGALHNRNLRINQVQCNFTQVIDTQLKQFWELEEISHVLKSTKEDNACENLFSSTTIRDDTGRFSVRIPMKESPDLLGETFSLAENRFLALERKLQRSAPEYKKLYCDFMSEYIGLGHMTRIDNYLTPHYFLPHHGVFREHSATTKLRVVFDASAKSSSGVSFNDIQEIGPPLQNDIFSILLRLRQFQYVACADIEKMYRQILIQPDQRHLQLILWRSDPSDKLEVYKLNTVTYGTASAPYLSMRCLKQLALECGDDVIARVINEDFYVDDLIVSHENMQTLIDICNAVSRVLDSGCFPLRKWIFNFNFSQFNSDNTFKQLALGDNCQTKTLGLGFLTKSDELFFTSKCDSDVTHATKRSILSVISQIYDPLGLLSPTIIIAKIILQKLWLCKLGWDDPVPHTILSTWQNFINNLKHLNELRIPRHVKCEQPQRTELHMFSDASQDAYGACAYVRSIRYNASNEPEVTVRLLCAKSKVAPVKPVSIPRLELCGALVGARLYKKITNSLRLNFNSIHFWTDSTIVIGWLKMSPRNLKTFVQNRVVEINELTDNSQWFHIAGKQNPADLLSRGTQIEELNSSNLWWHGPSFLSEPDFVPCDNVINDIKCDDLPDTKADTITMLTQSNLGQFPFDRFSCFTRMQRAAAYMLRFIHNTRTKIINERRSGPLLVEEINNANLILTRIAQSESFPKIHHALINNESITYPRNISGLNIFMDENELIRVGGRLNNSVTFSYNKKHPILLCSKHIFTRLLFRHQHKVLFHAGPQLLLYTIRETWWPLRGRDLARNTVHKCVKCLRLKGKSFKMLMGNLPRARIEESYPFIRCGVDYAGPVYILNRRGRGAKLEKAYICLFVCFITRAIHLELVTDLTSNAYLLALKRFISRRGKPYEIYSDNGKTFVGALKEFSKILDNNSDILDFTTNNNIRFKFIPSYTPQWGGIWEKGIGSCKFHLRRVVGNSNFTYEELSTALVQIEAILNSRPMTPMSTDPNDLSPLTPAHFLIGRPLTAPASDDLTRTITSRLPRYDRVEQCRQHFWQRWSKEYISELQTRTKWQTNQDTLIPNTLVLVKDDNLPPLQWRLGRVLKTTVGKDGIARVAIIKTAAGDIQRSYHKLCPILSSDRASNIEDEDKVKIT